MRIGKKSFASLGIAVLAFAALTGLALVIYSGNAERFRLESRNDAERTMNQLLAGLRDHQDFGAAIESVSTLRDKVVGIGAYSGDGARLYAWGEVPSAYLPTLSEEESAGAPVRVYLENSANDSLVLILAPFRVGPPPQSDRDGYRDSARHEGPQEPTPSPGFFFTTLRKADSVYLEIRQPVYWKSRRVAAALFPFVELALAALVLFVRGLVVRNDEYRRRIEEQRNLVVLGTAASTLAHEIKNPLLSIRLQARILEKTCPASAQREIGIINDEVERLSALSHRVGDYLRDPAGNPSGIDPGEVAAEVGRRLCGRDILQTATEPVTRVFIDPERLRSVLENLVRNALESIIPGTAGGGPEDVSIELANTDKGVRIDVLDRGQGLSPEAAGRLFDPFFTTKSRGTGIGLSVCKRFVEVAGGTIRLEARNGGGCVASVELPAREDAP
ncbi:MAG: hypothetical protein A2Y38_06450 [Spirochaetes bacterium GWB1_59_5]|nr:MAG: hypothetical protein A2Y38_06450 [Spirochaetes bacterium GWB1_59_5]